MESQKIYVNRNYRHITCGSVDRVRKVHTEFTDRGPRYYIEGDSRDRSVLKSLRYLEADPLGPIHPHTHTQEAERVEKETSPEEEPKTFEVTDKFDEAPDEYHCQDHDEMHRRGEVEYYGCIEKFMTGKWDSDVEKSTEPEVVTDTITDDVNNDDPDPITEIKADNRLHELNMKLSMKLISTIKDADELAAVYKGEIEHPMFPKGRVGIKLHIKKAFKNLRLPIPELE